MPIKIKRPNPLAGSKFEKKYKGKPYTLEVVKSEVGVSFKLKGAIYLTPTAAAKSITKTEVNGWHFWRIGS